MCLPDHEFFSVGAQSHAGGDVPGAHQGLVMECGVSYGDPFDVGVFGVAEDICRGVVALVVVVSFEYLFVYVCVQGVQCGAPYAPDGGDADFVMVDGQRHADGEDVQLFQGEK